MKLTKEDIGKKFNCNDGVITIVYVGDVDSCATFDDDKEGYRGLYLIINSSGICVTDLSISITSRHDPRSWLSDMPNLGDIKEGWIACDETKDWFWYNQKPSISGDCWVEPQNTTSFSASIEIFNMPELTIGQWKDSKISVAELKQWQADNS